MALNVEMIEGVPNYGEVSIEVLAQRSGEIAGEMRGLWLEMGRLNQELARRLPSTTADGLYARHCSIRASVQGGFDDFTQQLVREYLAEEDLPSEFREQLTSEFWWTLDQ